MIGSLIKINRSREYIIFDEEGKIIGITEEIMRKIFKNENINKVISSFFVFLIIPSLLHII
jgi:hypothetical protein